MRTIISLNRKWAFRKGVDAPPAALCPEWDFVNLPHTWNGIDGQDGGADFWRGTSCYVKELSKAELPQGERYLLDFPAVNASADVYVNGKHLCHHDGGYSDFKVDITDALEDKNLICVLADNSRNDRVYPQNADFTFYGGLYRGVNLIAVPAAHIDTETDGFPGLHVTPELDGDKADVKIETKVVSGNPALTLRYTLLDAEGKAVAETEAKETEATLTLNPVHRWHGKKDPYLYTARVTLLKGEEELDSVCARFGCREYSIDPEQGFILNGEAYPLRGVCRHQDRPDIGNALLPCHHEEDIALILEVGANTIRLAHYQQAQYMYDLCDEKGLIIWAEIPYISAHMPNGRENTVSQMRELITQNYNHPSIVVWGLSNEITMMTPTDEDMLENHRILNDLAHRLDPTRPTVMACVSMCSIDDPIVRIPDVISYNLYFGWYGGKPDMTGPWMDTFHEKYPETPIGLSEYGAEALNWHNGKPHQGDYSEEYQAYYHEEHIKQLFSRPYIWATHVWNMFDFAADGREEGGENGMNHKGLVTFDRKYKKDAFFAYKAWLSDEPFVHICGRRYADRVENPSRVTVYSNQPEVELFLNGVSLGKKTAEDHFFRFDVPNEGESRLTAVAGDCRDEILIRHVDAPNPAYVFEEKGVILSWQEISEEEGFYSLNDTLGDIGLTPEAEELLQREILEKMPKRKGVFGGPMDEEAEKRMKEIQKTFTVIRMVRLSKMEIAKEKLLNVNRALNRIRKPSV
ncbi:MAG: glycoside hydrolase family 2 protein [Clostridia bacterium]|nr:glycoside hydrolase family 2 protein [Clostridia bacterium]